MIQTGVGGEARIGLWWKQGGVVGGGRERWRMRRVGKGTSNET